MPGPLDRARPHIAASVAVIGVRLLLAAALAALVPEVAGLVLAMALGVFGVAAVYEHLRSAATGRTSQVPVPLRPPLLALWVAVGAGYAVRGLTGLALAVDLSGRPGLVTVAVVAMWALGVVFVTCRWSLEAMSFGSFSDGRVHWQARPDQSREHTLGLVRWVPAEAPLDGTLAPRSWRALRGRTPLTAPWNLALVVAAAAAALAGPLLAGSAGPLVGLVAVLLGALTAVAVAQLPGLRTVTAVGALLALGLAAGLTAALPLLVVLSLHRCFVRQCADEVGRPLSEVARRRLAPLPR